MFEYLKNLILNKKFVCKDCKKFKFVVPDQNGSCTIVRDTNYGFCEKEQNFFIPTNKNKKVCFKFKRK